MRIFLSRLATSRLATLALATLALGAVASAGPIVACQTVVVTPCVVGDITGVVTITDPSQVNYTIGPNTVSIFGNGPVGYSTSGVGSNAQYYDPVNGYLAANPYSAITQNAANAAALVASGTAPIYPNLGGDVDVTPSTTTSVSGYVDTPSTQQVNDYQTTIEAELNGGSQVYTMTFDLPFTDPTVQAAIAAADAILSGDGASFASPSLLSNSTSLTGAQTNYVVTGQSATGAFLTSTFDIFGPATIAVGNNQSELFIVNAAQLDIEENTEYFYATDRNAITTDTYLTTQVYEIDGMTSTSAVPEPATLTLVCAGLAGIGLRRRKRA